MKNLILGTAILFCGLSAARAQTREEQVRAALKQPVKKLKTFGFDPKVPLEERVGPAPAFLVEFLRKADGKKDYEAYTPTPEESTLLRSWLAELPPKMRAAFKERLIGMYFVKNLTGNGLTDFALDEHGKVYPLIVFNPVGFGRTLSQTLTLRDATAFKGNAGVAVDCGAGDAGMLYTILHEGTHAYDFIRGVTPYVEDVEAYATHSERKLGVSWDVWASIDRPRSRWDYPARHKVHFYGLNGGPALDADEAPGTYAQLAASPFVSLYGSQSWAEDVAELFTFYHLARARNRRCEIRGTGAGGPFRVEMLAKGSMAWRRADGLYGSLY